MKRRRIVGALLGPLVLLAVFPAPASAYPRPGLTERVSVASDGTEAIGSVYGSYYPAISADGEVVAFASYASNLVPGDDNGERDVFVHNRESGVTERVSVSSDGDDANSYSFDPAISADGRHVAFASYASNLIPADATETLDVFVHDRLTGSTEQVSVTSDGAQGNANSLTPGIGADGRHVAFLSHATNLVAGDTNGNGDVFIHDRVTGTTERVSVASGGAQANAHSYDAAIGAGGRIVAFHSRASNLVAGDTNGTWDVFVRDRDTGTTELVSVSSQGIQANSYSSSSLFTPVISAEGRLVAFQSDAYNLIPGDTNGAWDIFVHDRDKGTTERVSVASTGAEATAASYYPAISADGQVVSFHSSASNLVPGDTNGTGDVFVHDRATGITERVSVAPDGAQAPVPSSDPAISADGQFVSFVSTADNLVPGDTNGIYDVFVRDRGDRLDVIGRPTAVRIAEGVAVSGRATFSGVTIASGADPGDDGTAPVGPEAGAELTGAALIYRPEQEDILVKLRLSSLPAVIAPTHCTLVQCVAPSSGAGAPGVIYAAEVRVGQTRFEVRALRATVTSAAPRAPYFALYRCDPGCTEQAPLSGGIGTTGNEVRVSVPLSALGATEGTELTGLRALTAAGEAASGALVPLDEVALGSSAIPSSRVELGIAPVSASEDQVVFTAEADLLAGDFSGTLPTDGLPPGSHRLWARACLGDTCGPAAFREVAL